MKASSSSSPWTTGLPPAAGVAVTYKHFPGQFHGFFTMGKLLQQANVAASDIGNWLKALN